MCTNYWILYGPYYDSKDVCSDSQGSRGCSPPSLPDYICWFIRINIPKWHYDLYNIYIYIYIYTYVFPTEKWKFSASDVSFTRDPVDPTFGKSIFVRRSSDPGRLHRCNHGIQREVLRGCCWPVYLWNWHPKIWLYKQIQSKMLFSVDVWVSFWVLILIFPYWVQYRVLYINIWKFEKVG